MRAVVQRVASASVEVEGRVVSEIGQGLLVLIGVHESDAEADADYMYVANQAKASSALYTTPISFPWKILLIKLLLNREE